MFVCLCNKHIAVTTVDYLIFVLCGNDENVKGAPALERLKVSNAFYIHKDGEQCIIYVLIEKFCVAQILSVIY